MNPIQVLVRGIPQILVGIGAGLCGILVTLAWTPKRPTLAYLQHFAAGAVTAAAAVELFPEIERSGAEPWVTLTGFGIGGVAMAALRLASDKLEARWNGPAGLLLAAASDLLIDGWILGGTIVLGSGVGTIVAIALATEFVFVTLSLGGALRNARLSRGRAAGALLLVITGFGIGAVAGTLVLSAVPRDVLFGVLSFGAAVFLYLVVEELMVEAHAERTIRPVSTVLYFLGFFALLAFRELGG